MEVTLNAEETQTLMEILRNYRSDLRMEIVDTDNPEYKRPLKHKRDVIDAIVEKLHATAGEAPEGATPQAEVSLRIVAVW